MPLSCVRRGIRVSMATGRGMAKLDVFGKVASGMLGFMDQEGPRMPMPEDFRFHTMVYRTATDSSGAFIDTFDLITEIPHGAFSDDQQQHEFTGAALSNPSRTQ